MQSNMPILSNVLIEVGEKQVAFTANDTESYVRCMVPALESRQTGRATVSAEVLSRLARELPAEAFVRLHGEESMILIESRADLSAPPHAVYKLTGMAPEDFPEWPDCQFATSFEIAQRLFKRMIERILFAIATQDPRRVFTGGLLELKSMRLRLVASDGKKLAWSEAQIGEVEGQTDNSTVIPQKVLVELSRALGNEGVVKISLEDNRVAFDLDGAESRISYVSKRVEGRYPNYEAVVPKEFNHSIVANSEALGRVLRRASVVADEKNAPVIFSFQPNVLEVTSTSYDLGSFSGNLPIQYDGRPFDVAFNYKFVLDTLKSLGTADVLIKTRAPGAPTLFLPPDASDVLYLLMPIKISDVRPSIEVVEPYSGSDAPDTDEPEDSEPSEPNEQ
jgi:DNA polymerase-3 subunit beta